jgi:hypothetical protein
MRALRHVVLSHGGFLGSWRLFLVVAAIFALTGPSSPAQDQTIITNGLTQIAEELCRPDSALWYAPDGLGWRVYPIDYWQPMWVDFSEWPALQNLKTRAIATTNRCALGQVFYGEQPLHVTITLDLLSGDMTLSPGCSSEALATNSAPMGYQAGQWPVDCRVVEQLWQQWQSIQSNPDWQESYGGDARPFLTFHFQLADLNEAQTYTQNLAAEEAAWENAQQSSSSVAVTMETGEGEQAEGTATCTVTNLTQPFNILSVTQDTNCWTTITWESCPVFRYIVWSSDELSTNTLWLQHAYVWGEPNATSWTDATTTNVDHRFYKVQRILGSSMDAGGFNGLEPILKPVPI